MISRSAQAPRQVQQGSQIHRGSDPRITKDQERFSVSQIAAVSEIWPDEIRQNKTDVQTEPDQMQTTLVQRKYPPR